MAKLCDVTGKKSQKLINGAKRPDLLKRKIDVPELKESIRLSLSSHGLKVLEEAGGIVKYLKKDPAKKCSPKLEALKVRLNIRVEEPKKEAAPIEVLASETPPEEPKKEE